MKNILVISGHPNLSRSIANRSILEELQAQLPQAVIHRLDERYPDGKFDVNAEQQALLAADIIIWQFPMHWYALPALHKKWLDEVFQFGFAYGSDTRLAGKKLILSFTTGAPAEAYVKGGPMLHELPAFLASLESTANLCKLDLQQPVFTQGFSFVDPANTEAVNAQKEKAREHVTRLIGVINKA